jgi:hypothetical protein
MIPALSPHRAAVTCQDDGSIGITDPESAVSVAITVERAQSGRAVLRRLVVDDVSGRGITAGLLRRIPVPALTSLGALWRGTSAPNEALWRSVVDTKPPGSQRWPAEHWTAVLGVWEWAQREGRPGGGYQAIADLWGVSIRPTAHRWLRTARALTAAGGEPLE